MNPVEEHALLGGHFPGRPFVNDVLLKQMPGLLGEFGLEQIQGPVDQLATVISLGPGRDVVHVRQLVQDSVRNLRGLPGPAPLLLRYLLQQDGPEPGPEAGEAFRREPRQLVKEEQEHVLDQIAGIGLGDAEPVGPGKEQRRIELHEALPGLRSLPWAGSLQPLQQAPRAWVAPSDAVVKANPPEPEDKERIEIG